MGENLRIKSNGRNRLLAFLLGSLVFSSCAPAYSAPLDLTATAYTRNPMGTPIASDIAPTKKSMDSDGGLAAVIPEITPVSGQVKQLPTAGEIPTFPAPALKTSPTRTSQPSNTSFPTRQIPTIAPTSTSLPPTPTALPTITNEPTQSSSPNISAEPETKNGQKMVLYYSQAGDTRPAVAVRFGVPTNEITSPQELPDAGLLNPKQLLVIPNLVGDTGPGGILMPDSEVVYSPSALNFDINAFVNEQGGYLSTHREYLSSGWHTGAEVIQRVAIENSINPRILLSLLEYRSHWVTGQPPSQLEVEYPISLAPMRTQGLYHQLSWAVQQFSIGYYGWRAGLITSLTFPDGSTMRLAPELNAGTVAVQYLFSQIENKDEWGASLYSPGNLSELHEKMFGNPWLRAQTVEPLYPTDLKQPVLELPYKIGASWSFSGGPHSAWGPDGALAALDFAPPSNFHGCAESIEWITASAPGLVVRSANGVVIVDLDGDGYEQTGWDILYLHVATKDRIVKGTWLNQDDKIGHPSCEGGLATGTHVHIARKYNGEWILADGPMPFVLSGWMAHAGDQPYLGQMTKDTMVAEASTSGTMYTLTKRSK